MTDKRYQHLLKGSLYNVFARFFNKIIGFFSTMIIVRIIVPDDFGIFLKAFAVFSIIEIIAYTGFYQAILVIKECKPAHYATCFTLNIILSSFMGGVLYLTSDIWSVFLRQSELAMVFPILSLKIVLSGFVNPRFYDLQKEFRHYEDFLFQIMIKISSIICNLIFVFYFKNFMGLAWGQLFYIICFLILSYIFVPWRPFFSLSKYKDFLQYSFLNVKSNILEHIIHNMDRFLLVRYVSTTILGLYHFAFELAEQFIYQLLHPFIRTFFPVYASIQNDIDKLKETYIVSLSCFIPLIFFLSFGFLSIVNEFVFVYGGEKWVSSISFLNYFIFYSAFHALSVIFGGILGAIGHIKIRFYLMLSYVFCLLLLMIYPAMNGDVISLLEVKTSLALIFMIIHIIYMCVLFKVSLLAPFNIFCRSIFVAGIMFAVISFIEFDNVFLTLLFRFIIGSSIFIVLYYGLWYIVGKPEGVENKILNRIKRLHFKVSL